MSRTHQPTNLDLQLMKKCTRKHAINMSFLSIIYCYDVETYIIFCTHKIQAGHTTLLTVSVFLNGKGIRTSTCRAQDQLNTSFLLYTALYVNLFYSYKHFPSCFNSYIHDCKNNDTSMSKMYNNCELS